MDSVDEIMQLCRLCLVKDEVNIPIFEEQGDLRQIFLKISACLPVKVSKEDNLPKNICDGCSCKLETLYQFWNTSANSEKKLIKWLSQVDKPVSDKHSMNVDPVILKQEVVEVPDDRHSPDDDLVPDDLNVSNDAEDYLIQQQQLPYQNVEFQFQQEEFDQTGTDANVVETVPPSRKRRAAAIRAMANMGSEDEDNPDLLEPKIAKTEEESEESCNEDPEPTTFVGLPSATDNEQPGPSGVGKPAADAPFESIGGLVTQTVYECEVCTQIFTTKKDFLTHHINQFSDTFRCCRCEEHFKTTTDLYNHYEVHKGGGSVVVEKLVDVEYMDNSSNDLLYILDNSQCINEVVIEDEGEIREIDSETSPIVKSEGGEVVTVEHIEHGYMLPSVFKGQLQSKKRYKRRDDDLSSVNIGEEESAIEAILTSEATSSKSTPTLPKARPKRRHEVPDFSATNYIMLNPTDEIDIVHYKCLRCEQLFISKFGFFRHIEKGRCYINSCDVCSASFNKNSEFYEHYMAEHTDRAICNFCFRTFMYEKNVKEHMLRHLDQFRHRCEQCNKGFYTVREYRNHYKNRHMGIRHKCGVCSRSFADEYYFKRHVATHEKAVSSKLQLSL